MAVIGGSRAQNSAGVGLEDRGREHRSLASLYIELLLQPQTAKETS